MRRAWRAVVDFVVGDDLWVAVAVLALMGLVAVAVQLGSDPWWLLPTGVPVVLWVSLVRARTSVRRTGEKR